MQRFSLKRSRDLNNFILDKKERENMLKSINTKVKKKWSSLADFYK